VTVHLRADADEVDLEVAGNSKGFDPDSVRSKGGISLLNIRQRVVRRCAASCIAPAGSTGCGKRL
jgi:signal transduction histidine kinase